MKNITIRNINTEEIKMLYGKQTPGAERIINLFFELRKHAVHKIRKLFSKNEIVVIVVSLHGSMILPEHLASKEVFITHILDAQKFDYVLTNNNVTEKAFFQKIEKLNFAEILFLQDEIYRYWHIPEAFGSPEPKIEDFINYLNK